MGWSKTCCRCHAGSCIKARWARVVKQWRGDSVGPCISISDLRQDWALTACLFTTDTCVRTRHVAQVPHEIKTIQGALHTKRLRGPLTASDATNSSNILQCSLSHRGSRHCKGRRHYSSISRILPREVLHVSRDSPRVRKNVLMLLCKGFEASAERVTINNLLLLSPQRAALLNTEVVQSATECAAWFSTLT
jgi:hypothetical protein